MNTPPVDLVVERAARAATSLGARVVAELIEIAQRFRAPLEAASTVLVGRLGACATEWKLIATNHNLLKWWRTPTTASPSPA